MRKLELLLVAAFLVLAACGDGEGEVSAAEPSAVDTAVSAPTTDASVLPEPAFPVTVAADNGSVIVEAMPERIVALSATHIEMLYAMGAEDAVVAGDLFSNYPPAAMELTQLDSFNLSAEAVIALEPDLIILTFDPVEAIPAFEAVGIPTLLFATPTRLEGAYHQMLAVGAATGHVAEATALVDTVQADIGEIVGGVDGAMIGVTYYHETDPFSFYTPNSSSFIGQIYELFGMDNIADAAPDEFGSGFPQLSPEYIIEADPEWVFLAAPGETSETLAERDGWDTLSAVVGGAVVVLDTDVASRWGPRIVDLVEAIAEAIGEA